MVLSLLVLFCSFALTKRQRRLVFYRWQNWERLRISPAAWESQPSASDKHLWLKEVILLLWRCHDSEYSTHTPRWPQSVQLHQTVLVHVNSRVQVSKQVACPKQKWRCLNPRTQLQGALWWITQAARQQLSVFCWGWGIHKGHSNGKLFNTTAPRLSVAKREILCSLYSKNNGKQHTGEM